MFFLVKHFDARKPTQALVSILEKVPLKKNNIRERSRSEQILEEIYIISDVVPTVKLNFFQKL